MIESQNVEIRKFMERGLEITPLEALEKFGCMRLASRIGELKESGVEIQDRWVERNGKRYKAYSMATDKASLSARVGL